MSSEIVQGTFLEELSDDADDTPPPQDDDLDLDNESVFINLNETKRITHFMILENQIFEMYLQRNEPALIEGMTQFIENCSMMSRGTNRSVSKRFSMSTKSKLSFSSTSSSIYEKLGSQSTKLTHKQKIELLSKETESLKHEMEANSTSYKKKKNKLMGRLEELELRDEDLQLTISTFKKLFLPEIQFVEIQNEPLKMNQFIDQYFKYSRAIIDKLRLRTSSLKVKYFKLCHQLEQKELLGKDLQKVDFEYLHIDNAHLAVDIEKKLKLLIDLKKMTAKVNLILAKSKSQLLQKEKELLKIKQQIKFKEDKLLEFDDEAMKLSEEVDKARREHDKASNKMETYEQPDIMIYIKHKAEIGALKQRIKIWMRRRQIKEMSLNAIIRELGSLSNSFRNKKLKDLSKSQMSNLKYLSIN